MKFECPSSLKYASAVCGSIKFQFLVIETLLLRVGEKIPLFLDMKVLRLMS